jgi:hypothetical protein
MVARSDDFGATGQSGRSTIRTPARKPIRRQRYDVAYNHSTTIWVSSSHDRGASWSSVKAQTTGKGKIGWSLAGGGTVTPNGDVHFGWAGYEQNGVAKGPVNLYVSSSRDAARPGGHEHRDVGVAAGLLGGPVRLGVPGRPAHAGIGR